MGRNFVKIEIEENSLRNNIKRLSKIDQFAKKSIVKVVSETAVNIARDTVTPSNFPFITGRLKGSYDSDIRDTKNTLTAEAFSTVNYAPEVEGRKPFFYPAIEENTDIYYKALEKIIEKAAKK